MKQRVAVCTVAQIKNEADIWYQRFQGMAFQCLEAIVARTGVGFDMDKGIRTVVTVSDDVFDARTISDNALTDAVGAHFRGEEKIAQDGINALGYAMACILSGHDDLVLVIGHCKESQAQSRRQCTHLAFDPFYGRPVGLDYLSAAALQARAYARKARLTEDMLAEVVVRARQNGALNPFARDNPPVTATEVAASAMAADPLRELHCYPTTDWAAGMLLCCGERAAEFTDRPVWLTGFGSCMDRYFLGDRDLAGCPALRRAAARAYERAGVTDPRAQIEVFELNDAYAHQLPLWAEGVGLAAEGQGGRWIEGGGPDRHAVNRSGGMLNGNPIMLGGLARAVEAVVQLRREAGPRQVDGARRALAHGTTGPAGQHHACLVLER
jgi:acetyl-CoA C-acetyltransferase